MILKWNVILKKKEMKMLKQMKCNLKKKRNEKFETTWNVIKQKKEMKTLKQMKCNKKRKTWKCWKTMKRN